MSPLLAAITFNHICHADNAAAAAFVSNICVSCWHVHIALMLLLYSVTCDAMQV